MVYIGIGFVLIILISVITGNYFYKVAVARGKKPFLESDPDLDLNDDLDLSTRQDKQWWEMQVFDIWTQNTPDRLQLYGYFLKAKQPTNQIVILAHGYAGDAKTMSSFTRFYHENLGMNVFLPDARGHGKSGGKYIGFGWHERRDYQRWIDQLLTTYGENIEILLHGVSMGAATVMMTSGEALPSQVKAVIADCGYTSAMAELAYQMKRMYHLPSFPILHITSLLTKLRAGYSFQEASAIQQVQKSKLPILFIHGETDRFVPTFMVHELYQAASVLAKQLLVVPHAGHGLAYQTATARYQGTVTSFVRSYVHSDQASTSDSSTILTNHNV